MAVHPKTELLTHILDPSRSVEGNFRAYSVLTVDGVVHSGMLASESKTAIELFDISGIKISVLREEIEQLIMSNSSIMPEGFEKSIQVAAMTDLLEFLTRRGKFVPIDISKAATLPSDRSLFSNSDNAAERLIFPDWKLKTFAGVPFHLIDPRGGTVPNTIVLYGPIGRISRTMPRSVSLPVGGPAKAIHFLSGVAGWGHPYGTPRAIAMIVRLHYEVGDPEDHNLINGKHFADFIQRVDVPDSQFAFDLGGRQIRYFVIEPKRSDSITNIELIKGDDQSAPAVMAVTVESPGSDH